ncbi:glucosyl-3-phosphoglycerate synthase [Corynebacterium sp. 3HC-13]|uniref:glucosyl-3-phosphoglycerate synthase n=1 Tax=Corynebacterium poyangense TaxID=2684405 RepID=UPI001CCD08D3|nr:glucosyl-3-phosphoglycerate synthase [Corynebacterium poyangense]MBZ8177014.1 glucosyl-3-phosphoglycerate synthase [Corynebacterium poyangense]
MSSHRCANVSVVIPALNEEQTVAGVVAAVAADEPGEILVIDADSTDATAKVAGQAGATVLNWREILPQIPPHPGKGESLWRGLAAATHELVVFVDADLFSPSPGMVSALAEPFHDSCTQLVKAQYRRTFQGKPEGGGRVTELCAKPILKTCFPELAAIPQPLAGEYALRRETALHLPFVSGYGVEAGLLVDIYRRFGLRAIQSVDIGTRAHRNRPLADLAPMADIVAATLLARDTVSQRPPLVEVLGKQTC